MGYRWKWVGPGPPRPTRSYATAGRLVCHFGRIRLEAALRRMITVWHQSTTRAIRYLDGSYAFESLSRYFDVIRWLFCTALLQVERTFCLTQQSGVTPVGRASCVTAFQTSCQFNSRGTWPDSPGSQCFALSGLLIYETHCALTPAHYWPLLPSGLRLGVEWGKGKCCWWLALQEWSDVL